MACRGTYTATDIDAELARQLEVGSNQIEDLCSAATVKIGHGPEIHIGVDAEWVQRGEQNQILSVQLFMVGEKGTDAKVHYPKSADKSHRPRFVKLLAEFIRSALDSGVLLEWPSRVTIVGYFLRIDLAVFADLDQFKNQLDNVGGRAATIGKDAKITLDSESVSLKNINTVAHDGSHLTRELSIRFVDMGRHAPEGTALSALGEMLNLPKLLLPKGHSIERMDLLLKADRPVFEAYGIRDAEIPVRLFLHYQEFAKSEVDIHTLPTTGSALGLLIFTDSLKKSGADFNEVFGLIQSQKTSWSDGGVSVKAGVRSTKELLHTAMRDIHESFVAKCYHGGRNECYQYGPTSRSSWNDFDLAGAYTTGMVDLRHIDYEHAFCSTDPEVFRGHTLGFAFVRFKFPETVRYPSLPVDLGHLGVVFPLSGDSYCTAPEIEVALNLGCAIEIKHGVVFPWKDGDQRIFEPFTRRIRSLRSKFEKGSPYEQYVKFLGNSCYGKTAQGLKPKNVFDTRKMTMTQLPPSKITCAPIASHSTGLIRALLGEILNAIPENFSVVSVTTDGFLTDARIEDLVLSGPLAVRYQELCERVAPGTNMLECKHQVAQLIPFKTRGQITAEAMDGKDIVLARAGVSVMVNMDGVDSKSMAYALLKKQKQNTYMKELFLSRKPGDTTLSYSFPSIRLQWQRGMDMVKMQRSQKLNLEFDMKRRLVNPTMREVDGIEHISFQSVPWGSADIGEKTRAIFDGWRRTHCLINIDDWNDWCEHLTFSLARKRRVSSGLNSGINATIEGAVGVVRRLFLRAYAQGAWGLVRDMSYREVACWLSEHSYATKEDELKNAKRATLVEHGAPSTPKVMDFLSLIKKRFPTLEVDRFIATSNA